MPLMAALSAAEVGMRLRSPGTMVTQPPYTMGTCGKSKQGRQNQGACDLYNWQLQHSRLLTDTELGEQRDLAVGELKGIMVRIWILQVDLSEPSYLMTDVVRFPLEQAQPKSRDLTPDFAFK
jgi:hypothetical protein